MHLNYKPKSNWFTSPLILENCLVLQSMTIKPTYQIDTFSMNNQLQQRESVNNDLFHPWRGQGQKEWPWLRIFKRSELQQLKWLNEYGEAWNFTKCMGLGTCIWPFALYTIRTPQVPYNAIFMFSCFCSLLGPMKLGLSPRSETLQSELGMWCKVTLWARPFNKHLRGRFIHSLGPAWALARFMCNQVLNLVQISIF